MSGNEPGFTERLCHAYPLYRLGEANMPAISLRVEHLVLDNDNPRITHSDSQHETLQKVVKDQGAKLVRLAESVVEHGLSPIERLMVLQVSTSPKRYVALEGNRRVAALRLLTNPAAMTGLEIPNRIQGAIERLASIFDRSKVEPIDCFEVSSREEGRYWIELRHNGEDEGRGIVGWKPIVAARFRDKEPAIQALDMVLEHGGFTQDEADAIRSKFSLTTFRRFFESKDARALLGFTVKDKQLRTTLPGSELIKPLKRIINDIVAGKVESRRLNKAEQIISYINGFDKAEKPDLSKQVAERPVEAIENAEFTRTGKRTAKPKPAGPSERKQVVPKGCSLHVTDNRISEIYDELRSLKLGEARNAIAVLIRVFLRPVRS
jgi:hypothetical protein